MGGKEGVPTGEEGLVPALGLIGGGGTDADRPAKVMSVSKARDQVSLHIGGGEPKGQIWVGCQQVCHSFL